LEKKKKEFSPSSDLVKIVEGNAQKAKIALQAFPGTLRMEERPVRRKKKRDSLRS